MARDTATISNEQLLSVQSNEHLAQLTNVSRVSLFRLFLFVVAKAINLFEQILNQHKNEVLGLIRDQRSGRKSWYQQKLLDFQYGFDLITDTDIYDNSLATEEEIEDSKIISHAAVVETADDSSLIVKIATGDVELVPVDEDQQQAVEQYLEEIRFAGTRVTLINQAHDELYLSIDIYRDPLLIDSNGLNIRTGEPSVENAINDFLKNKLPFNGQLVLQELADALQIVEGVKIVDILNVETTSVNSTTGEYGQPIAVNVRHIPVSGYYRVVDFNNVRYVV